MNLRTLQRPILLLAMSLATSCKTDLERAWEREREQERARQEQVAPAVTPPIPPAPSAAVPIASEAAPPSAADIIAGVVASAASPTPPDVLAYNRQLVADSDTLRNIPEPDQTTHRRAIRDALRAVAQRQRSLRDEIRAASEREALTLICGSVAPSVGGWDGELIGSEAYMQRTAHDPDSIDVENCTVPILTRQLCWTTVCQVRGRNAFGAMVMNHIRFSVGRDRVILGAENVD